MILPLKLPSAVAWERGGEGPTRNHMYSIQISYDSFFPVFFCLEKDTFSLRQILLPEQCPRRTIRVELWEGGRTRTCSSGEGERAVSVRVYISTFAHYRGAPSHVELTFT